MPNAHDIKHQISDALRAFASKPLYDAGLRLLDTLGYKSELTLFDKILPPKKKDPNADTYALEKQIDEMVYVLYGLTPEEIAIVEGKK